MLYWLSGCWMAVDDFNCSVFVVGIMVRLREICGVYVWRRQNTVAPGPYVVARSVCGCEKARKRSCDGVDGVDAVSLVSGGEPWL